MRALDYSKDVLALFCQASCLWIKIVYGIAAGKRGISLPYNAVQENTTFSPLRQFYSVEVTIHGEDGVRG